VNIVGAGGGEGKDDQDNGSSAEKKSESEAVAKEDRGYEVAVARFRLLLFRNPGLAVDIRLDAKATEEEIRVILF
jgi:hypothetical protein